MISREAMFEAYKRRLMTEGAKPGEVKQWTRYNVVQYLCNFPKLDPDEMAAALIREGVDVRFDDSSISAADNAKHQRRVMRIVREMEDADAVEEVDEWTESMRQAMLY
jgi:hypothetical protein